jgi:integrase
MTLRILWQGCSVKSPHVVRKTLADGTVREYRYDRHKPPAAHHDPGSLGALIEAYRRSPEWRHLAPSTQKFYQNYLRFLEIGQGVRLPVADLRRRMVIAMRDEIAATRGDGAATGFVRTVSALMSFAVDREWIEHSPAWRVKVLRGGHLRAWTEEEYERALPLLPEPLRRAVVLARHTGQRRGDLVRMPWSAYDGSAVRVRQRKTGASLVIPATADLRLELDSWRREAVPILTTVTGRGWDENYLTHAISAAMTDIGMPGLSIHGLRKLAAASLAEAGCSSQEIMAVTGHTTLSMVELYTKSVRQEGLAGSAISRLNVSRAQTSRNRNETG